MSTHLEPDILKCKVKWVLGTITINKASRGDGIPVELFQILKDNAVKVLHSICQQIWKTSSGHRHGKDQFSFQSQRRAMPKNVQTTAQLHSTHMLARSVFPDVQVGFRKDRGSRDQIANIHSVQFSSVAQSCLTLCDPMNHSTPGLLVHQQLPESIQTHVHRVGEAIQPSHPLDD